MTARCTCKQAVREATAPLLALIERLTADRDDQNRVLHQMVTVGNSRSTEIASLKAQVEIEREAADRLNGYWSEQKAEIQRLKRTPSVDLSEHAVMAMELLDAQGTIAELRDHLSMAEDVNRALRAMLDGRKASAGHNGASEPESPPAARAEALRDEPTFPPEDMIA